MKASKLQIAVLWCLLHSVAMTPLLSFADADNSEQGGSILGVVQIADDLSAQRMRFRLYPGFKSIPPPTAAEKRSDEWQNIVIYLKSADSALKTTAESTRILQIEQRGETFIPHVLPIVKGSTVEFPNQDPIFHNVFSLSEARTFDLGRYPQGDSRSVTFEQPGIVPVFCHLHSDMSAIILVLDNPYFAVPGTDGHYRIDDIPAGSYTLVAWHERSEQVEMQVEVRAGEAVEINVSVPIEDDGSAGQ